MAFDEKLASRVRGLLRGRPDVSELRMFGGLTFMVRGHMACGVVADELMVRVGAEAHEAALGAAHARPMDFTGRPMRGFVMVGAAGLASDAGLNAWVGRSIAFVSTLPPK